MSYRSSLVIAEIPPQPISSTPGEASSIDVVSAPRQRRFKSARLIGEYEKPWIEAWKTGKKGKKLSGRTWDSIIFWVAIFVGFGLGAIMCYISYSAVSNFEYCLVFEDNFEKIDPDIWGYEIQRGGFGTGSFEWTTNDPRNAFVDAEGLHIVPTRTIDDTTITQAQILNGYTLNLTTMGVCTSPDPYNSCSIYSNSTSGDIINPIRSARLTTKGKKTITYGRVEVQAKMPRGDWLWPAIWMMPEDSVYGEWPASGEIDIAESRGNNGDTYAEVGGRDSLISALHWGPISAVDAFWRTDGKHNVRRTDYSDQYYTFGLEWSEKYLFTYINSRLLQVVFVSFEGGNMWNKGQFGQDIVNNSALHDPWSQTGRDNTPFDQAFYLILNVAVGGTNGFFPDQTGNKPWGDKSLSAPREFWNATDLWYPTWGNGTDRGLNVKSVKMWSQGACGSPAH
ncbi:glycoside hydrolase family 16 protein [Mollisia scopiformis]|uniref:Glycoside hydrolase family 16 protein n=1 Tax=Mollisia scopiformis TaxID=149040 RepID=A0A132BAQ6_MOLSC|nr:glycoside hydrolase family 16 protein [Mollisia scopiformis]KUJ09079.1 glycoside hydrolase family 16 protein [Mollisia scopiformis]